MRYDTQVMLVSHQPTPNLTPALDPELQPRRVIMLVSPDMRQRAEWLTDVLRPRGIHLESVPIPDAHAVHDLRQRLQALARKETGAIALNLTGGTKLMSIAAYEAFHAQGHAIFYVHPEHDRLIWLHPDDRPAYDLANRIRLDAFFRAHGARLEGRPSAYGCPEAYRQLGHSLIQNLHRYARALATLNYAASTAEQAGSLTYTDQTGTLCGPELREMINRFEAAGILRAEPRTLHFANPAARFFANGGWLEHYVYALVQDLRRQYPTIQDLGRSLEVTRRSGEREVRNELDVVYLADNRLHVIECKTRRFPAEGKTGGAGAAALYKLETLGQLLGGIQARRILVSYQPLKAPIRDRARDLRIETCAHTELPQLRDKLQRWLT